jgi:hypothetical protein
VEGGILPPGDAPPAQIAASIVRPFPLGKMPSSWAGETPAATEVRLVEGFRHLSKNYSDLLRFTQIWSDDLRFAICDLRFAIEEGTGQVWGAWSAGLRRILIMGRNFFLAPIGAHRFDLVRLA